MVTTSSVPGWGERSACLPLDPHTASRPHHVQVLYLAHPVALDFDGWPNPRPWHGRRSLGATGLQQEGCQWWKDVPTDVRQLYGLKCGDLADACDGAPCNTAATARGAAVQQPHARGTRVLRRLRAEGPSTSGGVEGASRSRQEDLRTAIDEFSSSCEAFLQQDAHTFLLKPLPFTPAAGSAARVNKAGELHLVA